MPGKPIVQAMVLADQIYRDASSGKMVIAGTFTRLIARRPPPGNPPPQQTLDLARGGPTAFQRAGSPWLYLTIGEVHGQALFQLQIVRLADNQVFFEAQINLNTPDPLTPAELALPLPLFPTDQPAVFAIELLHEGELIASTRLGVVHVGTEEHHP